MGLLPARQIRLFRLQRQLAGQHLEQQHPETVDIRRGPRGCPPQLLRSRVAEGAAELSTTPLVRHTRHPEIQQFRLLEAILGFPDQNIRRLQIPMHDRPGRLSRLRQPPMGAGQSRRNLTREAQTARQG